MKRANDIFSEKNRNKDTERTPDQRRSFRLAQHWKDQYEQLNANKDFSNWHKRGTDTQRRYRDERKSLEKDHRRLNTLWAWYETIKPAVYGQVPQANIERRFLDHDPTGRLSAQILERALRNELEINHFDNAMHKAVQDYLLAGRGQVWVRYEPKDGQSESIEPTSYTDLKDSQGNIEPENDTETEEKLEDTGSELIQESALVDYINWKDFGYYPADARTWAEVQAVSKDVYLSEEECIERFGEEVGKQIQPEGSEPKDGLHQDTVYKVSDNKDRKRKIIEIWDKATQKVYYVSMGYQYLCKEIDDPLHLTGFFPCPEPLDAINTTDTFIPVPFYHEFQDQCLLIDDLSQRSHMLTKALKACGFYDASAKGLQRLMNENTENAMIPIEQWTSMGEKGIEDAVSFFPVEVVAEVLGKINEQLEIELKKLDLITGISDVMRGTGDARETLGGQRLKSNAAGTRVEDMRKKVGRFARDTVRLLSEVIAKHFSDKTLIEASGILYEEGIPNELGQAVLAVMDNGPSLVPSQSPLQLPGPSPLQAPTAAPGLPAPQLPPQPPGAPQAPSAPSGAMTNTQAGGPPMPMAGQLSLQAAASPMGMLGPVIQAVQKIRKAIDLLRDDIPRAYRIEIEVDTLVAGDHQEERQDATEFITAVTQFIGQAGQIIQVNPAAAPLFGKMLQFGVRKFRTGRDLEASIDEFVDQISKQAQQGQPNPHQNPAEAMSAQADQMKAQAEIAKAKLDAQAQQQNDQRQAQLAQQDFQLKQMEKQMEMAEMQRKEQFAQAEHNRKMAELAITHNQAMQQHQMQQQTQLQTPVPPNVQ